jgi:hypothetical protein
MAINVKPTTLPLPSDRTVINLPLPFQPGRPAERDPLRWCHGDHNGPGARASHGHLTDCDRANAGGLPRALLPLIERADVPVPASPRAGELRCDFLDAVTAAVDLVCPDASQELPPGIRRRLLLIRRNRWRESLHRFRSRRSCGA